MRKNSIASKKAMAKRLQKKLTIALGKVLQTVDPTAAHEVASGKTVEDITAKFPKTRSLATQIAGNIEDRPEWNKVFNPVSKKASDALKCKKKNEVIYRYPKPINNKAQAIKLAKRLPNAIGKVLEKVENDEAKKRELEASAAVLAKVTDLRNGLVCSNIH